jgi:outer membrane protein W
MRKLIMAALVALLVPTASHAQFQLGLRLGYAPAMGNAFKDPVSGESAKMKDGVKSQIPLQLDASYKFTPDVAAGLYFSYGVGQVGGNAQDVCDANGTDCSASAIRLGVQGIYTFNQVQSAFLPWAGAGIGYERAQLKQEGFGAEEVVTASGFELNLQAGGDYKVTEKFAIGPYVMFSMGQFTKVNDEISAGGLSADAELDIDKAFHQWFGFGIRGKFDL